MDVILGIIVPSRKRRMTAASLQPSAEQNEIHVIFWLCKAAAKYIKSPVAKYFLWG
jgi:hypothetical protein